jgi:hypothetical protein
MKNHGKHYKEMSGMKEKRDSKSKTSYGESNERSNDENRHRLAANEDLDNGISFLIVFSLKDGQIEGTITHRLTDKLTKFSGLDQTAITQFMKKYLSGLEKSVEKMPIEEQPFAAVQQREEARITPSHEMRTRSFRVIPEGSSQHVEFLQKGQPFELQWSFESPSVSDMEGEQLHYRIMICGKNLEGGKRLKISDTIGQISFGSPLTASIHFAPLPPGTYRLEADSDFSLKSKISNWHSACREKRLIQVI